MNTKFAVLVALSGLVAGCGGGGGDNPVSPTMTTGVFVDSAVQGIAYTCGNTMGVTDAKGTFNFVAGDTCTFRVGGITLGSVKGKAFVTPVDLVAGATNEMNPTVTQMTQFLMSLDNDNDPSNGIVIDPAAQTVLAGKTLDFTQPAAAFANAARNMMGMMGGAMQGRMLTDASSAQAHLGSTLVGLFSGSYHCTYNGTATGTVTVSITNGMVTGTGQQTGTTATFSVDGTVSSSGSASLNITSGGTSNGASWSGAFSSDGTGSGMWTQPGGDNGNWGCTKG